MVKLQNVSKIYRLYPRATDRILEIIPFSSRKYHTDFWALRDISLEVAEGEIVAFIGPNGSGKSTLLQIVSGILQPTRGMVWTRGRIAALLELGAGFNPEFTGRENVFLNGEIMGFSRGDMSRIFPRIEEFAGIGEFIDRPVKEYSSGMYVRLAFSTAIHVEPEVLIVDEALAVGDAVFANRCVRKFEELRRRKVTILFVSHDLGLVKRLAHRAVLLVHGAMEMVGPPSDVVNRYVGMVLAQQTGEEPEESVGGLALRASHRHGDKASRITSVLFLAEGGQETRIVRNGESVTVRVRAEFLRAVSQPVVGILIRNRLGIDVFGTNTRLEGRELGTFEPGDALEVEFRFDCLLSEQEYTLTAATQHWEGLSQDWLDDVLGFRVVDPKGSSGLLSLRTGVEWSRVPAVPRQ